MNLRIFLVLLLALSGCQCTSHKGSVVRISGKKSNVEFNVEIVRTDEDRQRGLMFRDSLAQNSGMIFIFDQEGNYPFWMKNTKIPLDIIYFDSDWKVVGILEDMEPMSRASRGIGKPARYVLEINAGLAKKEGLNIGDVGTLTEEKKQ